MVLCPMAAWESRTRPGNHPPSGASHSRCSARFFYSASLASKSFACRLRTAAIQMIFDSQRAGAFNRATPGFSNHRRNITHGFVVISNLSPRTGSLHGSQARRSYRQGCLRRRLGADQLSKRDRSLITVAALVALYRPEQLRVPYRTRTRQRRDQNRDFGNHHPDGLLLRMADGDDGRVRRERGLRKAPVAPQTRGVFSNQAEEK